MKNIRPSAKREVQTEQSAMFKYSGARSATIESRDLDALKYGSCEGRECTREAGRFFNPIAMHQICLIL